MKTLLKRLILGVIALMAVALISTNEAEAAKQKNPRYLQFSATEDNSSVKFSFETGEVQYSVGNDEFATYINGTEILLDKGDTVRFFGEKVTTSVDKHFVMRGGIEAAGSVTSLTDGWGWSEQVELSDSCYAYMFSGCTALKDAPILPATTLAEACYRYMFYGCSSLTEAPALPATTLADSCYYIMFVGCSSLTEAPALPATTLADSCYTCMFSDCTALKDAPILPATTLADSCYYDMFGRCSSLTEAPALPATTLADSCYCGMFWGCSSLTEAPALPATTLAEDCYNFMFGECSSLTKAPVLPATALADNCYYCMFAGCTNLLVSKSLNEDLKITDTFTLPATTAEHAVDSMFLNAGKDTAISSDKLIDTTPESNVTYYCKYRKCNIKYELNEGVNNSTNLAIYAVGIGVPKFSSPTKDGYVFEGWYSDAAFTTKVDSITAENIGDITLFAKWTKNPYTETLKVKNATYELAMDSDNQITGVKLTSYTDNSGCTALKTVTIKTTKLTDKKLGKSAFSSINANATIKVPKSKLSAYQKLLKKVGVTKKTQKIKK